MDSGEKLHIRPHCENDLPFITSTWLKSYRHGSFLAQKIRADIFFDFHRRIVDRILKDDATKALVACSYEDPDIIFGYLVYAPARPNLKPVMHFTYTKHAFRELGIAGELLRESGVDLNNAFFTHHTIECEWITSKFPELTFHPHLL
jgi:hypothetical protein